MEIASEAFSLGGLYQRMQMDAPQVIGAMQNLADRLFIEHIKLTATLPVLQFLREEIGMTTAAEPDLAHMPPADESH